MRCPKCEQRTMVQAPDGDYLCQNCGQVDRAGVELAHYERDHYVWFDETDKPGLVEGWAGFYGNAVQLEEIR